jgi:Tol biopolymer transport system component
LLVVNVADGSRHTVAPSREGIFHQPAWMPDSSGLILPVAMIGAGHLNSQLAFIGYPGGELRQLTTDTNDYSRPSISVDGRNIVAIQSQSRFQIFVSSAQDPDEGKPVPLMSQETFWKWGWMSDGHLVIPQGGDIRVVNPTGGETVALSDSKHPVDQVTSCGNGRYLVYRQLGKAAVTSVNLWRMDAAGGEPKQLTFGHNEAGQQCSPDGKWVYYQDVADNQALKRVSIDGGTPEPVWETEGSPYTVAPDGNSIARLDVQELDHKLVLALYSIPDRKVAFHNIDQRASSPLAFMPDGKSFLYTVREKGIDNLWTQPLDGSAPKQMTHFTSNRIALVAFSPDGAKLAVERGHSESDAVVVRDLSR